MKTRFLLTTALTVGLTLPVQADPTVGLGMSFVFGNGAVETGVGVRVFSDDKRDSFVGTAGLDYMFQSQRWRPTVGAAYLGNNTYLGIDLGLNLNGGGLDVGVGAGGVRTVTAATPPASTFLPTTIPPTTVGPTLQPTILPD